VDAYVEERGMPSPAFARTMTAKGRRLAREARAQREAQKDEEARREKQEREEEAWRQRQAAATPAAATSYRDESCRESIERLRYRDGTIIPDPRRPVQACDGTIRGTASPPSHRVHIASSPPRDFTSCEASHDPRSPGGSQSLQGVNEGITELLNEVAVDAYLEGEGMVSARYARCRTAKGRRLAREDHRESHEIPRHLDRADPPPRDIRGGQLTTSEGTHDPRSPGGSESLQGVNQGITELLNEVAVDAYLEGEGMSDGTMLRYARCRTAKGRRLAREARGVMNE